MRREFSKTIKRDAFLRAKGFCEGCSAKLSVGKFHYDHDIADGLGGEPELWNCKVLCHTCHHHKTSAHDVPLIAKVKRISDKHNGIRNPSRMRSAGFRKAAPQQTASRPIERRS